MKTSIRVPFWALYAQVVIAAIVVALFVHLFALSWQNDVNSDRERETLSAFTQLSRADAVRIRHSVIEMATDMAVLEHELASKYVELAVGEAMVKINCSSLSTSIPLLLSFSAWVESSASFCNISNVGKNLLAGGIEVLLQGTQPQGATTSRNVDNASLHDVVMSLSYVLPLNVSKGAATLQSILNNNNGSTMGPVAPLASWLASTTNVFQIESWNSRFANRTSDLLSEMLNFLWVKEAEDIIRRGRGNGSSSLLVNALLSSLNGTSSFRVLDFPLLLNANCSSCQASPTNIRFGIVTGSLSFLDPNVTSNFSTGGSSSTMQLVLLTVRLAVLDDLLLLAGYAPQVDRSTANSSSKGNSSEAKTCADSCATRSSGASLAACFLVDNGAPESSRVQLFGSPAAGDAMPVMANPDPIDARGASSSSSSSGAALSSSSQPTYVASISVSSTLSLELLYMSTASTTSSQKTLLTLIVVTWTVLIGVSIVTALAIRTSLIGPLNTLAVRMHNATRLRFSSSSSSRSGGGGSSRTNKNRFFMFTELEHLLQTYGALESSTRMFSKYVPREVVKDLMVVAAGGSGIGGPDMDSSGLGRNSGGRQSFSVFLRRQQIVEQRLITVLFADIANFTTFCEMVPTEDLVILLDHYFSNMTTTLLQHGCTIDKFIGDAIMGFWGAPLDYVTQGFSCCCAALHLQKMVLLMTPVFNTVGFELEVRVGCHRGFAVVGNVGCSQRMSYTALGDTVNAASRLEGLNKMFGSKVMVSAPLVEDIADAENIFVLRDLGAVKVKGKSEAISVFHLVGIAPDAVPRVRRMTCCGGVKNNNPTSCTSPPCDDDAAGVPPPLSNKYAVDLSSSIPTIIEDAKHNSDAGNRLNVQQQLSRRRSLHSGSSTSSDSDDDESVFSGTAVRTHIRMVDGPTGEQGGVTATPLLNGRGNARSLGGPPGAGAGGKTTVFEKVAKWSAEAELEQISHGFTITRPQQQYIALLNKAAGYYAKADLQMAVAVLKEALDTSNDVILEDLEMPKEPLMDMLDLWSRQCELGVDPATFDPSIVLTTK